MDKEEFLRTLPNLAIDYKPADQVLDKLKNIDLLMVIGPSGVGKTTILKGLGLAPVIVDTTRAPRAEEVNGKDFNFRQDYDQLVMDIKSGEFVQMVVGVSGDFYSTRAGSYPDYGQAVMAVIAEAVPHFRTLGFRSTVSVFITPPSYVEWMRRISSHQLTQEQLDKRLAEARRSLHLALLDKETHFILNDELDLALNQIKGILGGKIDFEREGQARSIALKLSDILK